jgi:hypothetical protein
MKRTIKVFVGDAATERAGDANADGALDQRDERRTSAESRFFMGIHIPLL